MAKPQLQVAKALLRVRRASSGKGGIHSGVGGIGVQVGPWQQDPLTSPERKWNVSRWHSDVSCLLAPLLHWPFSQLLRKSG